MILTNKNAQIFIPDKKAVNYALERTTQLSIGAHQDDIEIMSYHGIQQCFGIQDEWFCGVVVTNGAGSPRDGLYKNYSDIKMQKVRRLEQKKAAIVGEYGALVMLDYSSAQVKDAKDRDVINDIKKILIAAQPKIVYAHNLADKHDTHVAVVLKTIFAIRQLPKEARPKKLYGCEVWRSLDWMVDSDKTMFDMGEHPNIEAAVLGVYDSQICGGKRYDKATEGRRLANATYAESHNIDKAVSIGFGMELTPLIDDTKLDVMEFVSSKINHFKNDVLKKIAIMKSNESS